MPERFPIVTWIPVAVVLFPYLGEFVGSLALSVSRSASPRCRTGSEGTQDVPKQ